MARKPRQAKNETDAPAIQTEAGAAPATLPVWRLDFELNGGSRVSFNVAGSDPKNARHKLTFALARMKHVGHSAEPVGAAPLLKTPQVSV